MKSLPGKGHLMIFHRDRGFRTNTVFPNGPGSVLSRACFSTPTKRGAGRSLPARRAGTAFAEKMANATSWSAAVPILATGNPDMKQPRHFENVTPTTNRAVACIKTLIEDMQRVVILLEDDAAAENERSRIRGYSEAESSIRAKALAERRDNLNATIATLETRL
jgi:hypothetical protein